MFIAWMNAERIGKKYRNIPEAYESRVCARSGYDNGLSNSIAFGVEIVVTRAMLPPVEISGRLLSPESILAAVPLRISA